MSFLVPTRVNPGVRRSNAQPSSPYDVSTPAAWVPLPSTSPYWNQTRLPSSSPSQQPFWKPYDPRQYGGSPSTRQNLSSSSSPTSGYDVYKQYSQGRTSAGQHGNTGSSGLNTMSNTGRLGSGQYSSYSGPSMGAASTRNAYGNAGWSNYQSPYSGTGMSPWAPPAAPPVDQDLENRALQAALNRIKSEYAIRIAEPESQLNSLAGRYQQAMQGNALQFGEAERGRNATDAQRGLLRSGVRNTEMQRAFAPIEAQRREIQNTMAYGDDVAEKDWGTQAIQLQAAIEQLKAAAQNTELERRIQAEQSGLQHRLAMANPGG